MTHIVAVNAGLSEPSSTRLLVDRIVDAVAGELASDGQPPEVSIIDLRSAAADIGSSLAAGFATGQAREGIEQVHAADALIVATPVFNASYSGCSSRSSIWSTSMRWRVSRY